MTSQGDVMADGKMSAEVESQSDDLAALVPPTSRRTFLALMAGSAAAAAISPSVSSASTLAPLDPISGTVSGSGSSTSTNFCSECTSSSLRSSGEIVCSAISRSETTGFLSLSRSIVSCEPDEIIRARWAASSTKSKRLSTLSMQSSTVTRAMPVAPFEEPNDGGLCIVAKGG